MDRLPLGAARCGSWPENETAASWTELVHETMAATTGYIVNVDAVAIFGAVTKKMVYTPDATSRRTGDPIRAGRLPYIRMIAIPSINNATVPLDGLERIRIISGEHADFQRIRSVQSSSARLVQVSEFSRRRTIVYFVQINNDLVEDLGVINEASFDDEAFALEMCGLVTVQTWFQSKMSVRVTGSDSGRSLEIGRSQGGLRYSRRDVFLGRT